MTERYHPRRVDRTLTEPGAAEAILREGQYATFALCDGGEPYVVTLSYGYDAAAERLYFHVAHEGHKLRIIEADPRACGTVVLTEPYLHGECAHPYRSAVMRGVMRVVDTAEEKHHAIRTLVEHLERSPDVYWDSRKLDEPERTAGFTALCFEIEHVVAKTGK